MNNAGSIRWDRIIDPLPLGACLVGDGFKVLQWNRCIEVWTGISKERILGRDLRTFFPHLQSAEYEHLFNALLVNGTPGLHHDLQIEPVPLKPFPDPLFMIRQISISAVVPEGTEDRCVLVLFGKGVEAIEDREQVKDLMERAQVEEKRRIETERALKDKSEELIRANHHKFKFLSDMSHELRTPLNSILLLSKLITDKNGSNLSAKQREFATTIYSAGTDLLKLINDILDHSKVDAGRMVVEKTWVDPRNICTKMERYFQNEAEEKGLSFSIDMRDCLYREIHTDAQKLEQILKNLISNALKFTVKGYVKLTVAQMRDSAEAEDDTARAGILFSVSDTGIGIEEDKQQAVFEAFRQLQDRQFQVVEGTGLGLAISRKFAELLGGSLHLDSEAGKGSTFSFFLPEDSEHSWREAEPQGQDSEMSAEMFDVLSPDEREGLWQEGHEEFAVDSKTAVDFFEQDLNTLVNRKVMILGSDMRSLFTISNQLEKWQMQVIVCKSPAQAVVSLRNNPEIDLMLYDAGNRVGPAIEVVKELITKMGLRKLPLLILVSKVTVSELDLFIQAGAADCLLKPLDRQQLIMKMLSSMTLPTQG